MEVRNTLLVILLTIISQFGFGQNGLAEFQSEMEGTWEWVRTEPLEGSEILNPDLCECSKTLVIQPESNYAYTEDGKVVYQGGFTLLMSGEGPSPESYFFVGNHFNLGVDINQDKELLFGSFSSCKGVMVFRRKINP